MKILFVAPRLPYPPEKGDQVVVYHRLRTLGPRHDITLLTFGPPEVPPEHLEVLHKYCSRVVTIPHPVWKAAWNLGVRGFFSRIPFQVLFFRSAAFRKALGRLLEEDFQVVHGFMLRIFPYLQNIKPPVLLECVDSMQLNFMRLARASSWPKSWIYHEEWRRLRDYEPAVGNWVARTVFVSPIDAEHSRIKNTIALPLGVEPPEGQAACANRIVVFSGNMGYGPNVQAVQWFAANCWPAVREAVPDAIFRVIGGNPSSAVAGLQRLPGVEVTGWVPDMMESLKEAGVAIAPMQSGSGMQSKILEAMACGLPVVATTLGLGAIKAVPGKEILVQDEAKAFAEEVIGLLANEGRRKDVGRMASDYVKAGHSWHAASTFIERLYSDLAG